MAGLHLFVEPGHGIDVCLAAPVEHLPLRIYRSAAGFRAALDGYARGSLARGRLRPWDVDDIRITVTDCGWFPPVTTAADFRRVLHGLLRRALTDTGTVVCEPVQHVDLTCPAEVSAAVVATGVRRGLAVEGLSVEGASAVVRGLIPVTRLGELEATGRPAGQGPPGPHGRAPVAPAVPMAGQARPVTNGPVPRGCC